MNVIYRLMDQRTGRTRYVGKTNDPRVRAKNHCQQKLGSRHYNTHCSRWIRELKSYGLRPLMEVLEELDYSQDWQLAEQRWIAYFRAYDEPLTNLTDGGEGCTQRVTTEETREKLRKAFTGRPIPPEQRALISASLTGKLQTPETVARRKAAIIAKYGQQGCFGDEHRKAVSEGLKGRVIGEATREKLRQANLGKKQSAETIAKRMQSAHFKAVSGTSIKYRRAKMGSPEYSAKLSAIHKARLASLTPEQREARMAAAKAKNWRNTPQWVAPTFEEAPRVNS